MNFTMIRSGDSVFISAEYVKGYAFKSAVAGAQSAHFPNIATTATGSSFASMGVFD